MASRLHFDVEVGTVELSLFLCLLIFLGIFRLLLFGLLFVFLYVLVENQRHKVKALYEKMEPKAVELLDVLRNMNLTINAKVSLLNSMKSDMKQKCVPENAIAPIWKHSAPCAEQTQVRALDIESEEDNQKNAFQQCCLINFIRGDNGKHLHS